MSFLGRKIISMTSIRKFNCTLDICKIKINIMRFLERKYLKEPVSIEMVLIDDDIIFKNHIFQFLLIL